jgi:hypothetical protein
MAYRVEPGQRQKASSIMADPRVCQACCDVLQAHPPLSESGEPTYHRAIRGSRKVLATSQCPVCQRFHHFLTTSKKDPKFIPDSSLDPDMFEITLDDSPRIGSTNYLGLLSPGLLAGSHDYLDMYADEGERC